MDKSTVILHNLEKIHFYLFINISQVLKNIYNFIIMDFYNSQNVLIFVHINEHK